MRALADLYEELRTYDNDLALADIGGSFLRLARQNKRRLSEFVETVPLDAQCALFEVYEALADDASSFHDFYTSELRRLLSAAETHPNNRHIYQALEAFGYLEDAGDRLVEELRGILYGYLDSNRLPLRRFATWLIGDFISTDSSRAIDKLLTAFKSDPDFRVRYMAYVSLREGPAAHRLPALGLAERLRLRWVGNTLFEYTA